MVPEGGWPAWVAIIIIAFVCLLISGFVSGSEIAFFGLTPDDIDTLRTDSENRRCAQAYRLLKDSERLLATILISNNLVNITMVILLTFAISQTVQFNSTVLAFLLQTVLLTLLLLIFGEILPKLIAKSRGLAWVKWAAPAVTALYHFFKPLEKVLVSSSSFVGKVVTKRRTCISTDELETALEISNVSEGKDKEMLEGILSIGEKQASDVMIPRIDVTAIEYHDTWQQAIDMVIRSGYSRILYSKDLLPYIGRAEDSFDWRHLIREAYFVPESRMLDDLLEDFRQRKIHIAIVIDEYGGTDGIVTLEDMTEELVGDIRDEYDLPEEKGGERTERAAFVNGVATIEGGMTIEDFADLTGIELEDGPYETVAGYFLAHTGKMGEVGDVLSSDDGYDMVVTEVDGRRIETLEVRRHTADEDGSAAGDSAADAK